ncbi:MAG: hypothetical protein ACXAC8_05670 [Candidatus Hodarchaeales archaeon]|jgi:hypothetical protein
MTITSDLRLHLNSFQLWLQNHSEFVGLAVLIVIGWVLRLFLAVNSGGMVHPDEIYQSLEIAHDMKYGFGFIPWEFKIPENPGDDGAARSYLFPLLFFYIFELCEAFGIPYGYDGTLTVVRIFSASYCTLLIPIIYFFSKELLPPQKPPHLFSLFATFLVTIWFQFPFFGIRTITNSFVTPIIFGALYLHLYTTNRKKNASTLKFIFSEFFAGILLGLACSLRMDSVVFFAPFFILRHQNNRRMIAQYIQIFIGFVTMFFIQGMNDLHFYGTFLASPINWFIFNILEAKSSIFGVQPFFYYFGVVLMKPFYSVLFAILVGMLIFRIQKILHKQEGSIQDKWFFATLELLIWFFMSIVVMSLVEHKEERFIFSLFPVIMILFAAALKEYFILIEEFYQYFFEKIKPKFKIFRELKQNGVYFLQIGLLFSMSAFTLYSSVSSSASQDWAFFHDVNMALEWVGDQENSNGVIVFTLWFYTGGWTYLHKDIRISFNNNPGESNSWQYLDYSEYNYLITPKYQYWHHENLEQQINSSFLKINTILNRVDVWIIR